MKVEELKLDDRGTKWKTITLSWYELREIEKAVKLLDSIPSEYSGTDWLFRVASHFVVKKTQDGIEVSFDDVDIRDSEDFLKEYVTPQGEGKVDLEETPVKMACYKVRPDGQCEGCGDERVCVYDPEECPRQAEEDGRLEGEMPKEDKLTLWCRWYGSTYYWPNAVWQIRLWNWTYELLGTWARLSYDRSRRI